MLEAVYYLTVLTDYLGLLGLCYTTLKKIKNDCMMEMLEAWAAAAGQCPSKESPIIVSAASCSEKDGDNELADNIVFRW